MVRWADSESASALEVVDSQSARGSSEEGTSDEDEVLRTPRYEDDWLDFGTAFLSLSSIRPRLKRFYHVGKGAMSTGALGLHTFDGGDESEGWSKVS